MTAPSKARADDAAVAKAKKKIGEMLDVKERTVTEVVDLVTALAKLKATEGKGDDGGYGGSLDSEP